MGTILYKERIYDMNITYVNIFLIYKYGFPYSVNIYFVLINCPILNLQGCTQQKKMNKF